jgi:CDP-glycerol glycerophosphotransferase
MLPARCADRAEPAQHPQLSGGQPSASRLGLEVPRLPLISVVIPIHNVEAYLLACLESVASQTVGDLEVIMVDDGSTDGSAAIAEEFAAHDPRFRLVSQPNGGLGQARNTGADAATGEFLAFVDSDDMLPRNAYELLLEPLKKTGSDFATGNVYRLTSVGTSQTRFLAKVFVQTQLKTHITRFRPLLADRIVPNKLWRRAFWVAHGFRFPEGMVHEDIPVVLPAQFAARSVDVIAEPVYLYRIREGIDASDQSITQRRLDMRALLDRVTAVEHVRDYLAREGPRKARRWYEQSVVAEDLIYFLNVLDNADDEYRAVFLDRVNGFLDRAGRHVYDDLLAIDRLKWHLVRRRLVPELLEVLRFQRERLRDTPPVRVGRRWYGDYPFRTDPSLGIPRSVYRLDKELAATPHVDDLRWEQDKLVVEGYVFISGIGAPRPDSQRVSVTVLKEGPMQAIRQRISALRLRTSATHRPDATANSSEALCDLEWSGFAATLDPRRLRRLGRWREGVWEMYVTVRAGGVTRRRVRFRLDRTRPVRAVDRQLPGGVLVRASPTANAKIAVDVRRNWATIHDHRLSDGVADLSGNIRAPRHDGLKLRPVGPGVSRRLEYPLEVQGEGSPSDFSVRVPVADLSEQAEAAHARSDDRDGETVWDLYVAGDERRYRMAAGADIGEARWPAGSRELYLHRTQYGDASLVARAPQAVVTDARWSEDGVLELRGDLRSSEGLHELVLHSRFRLEQHVFPLNWDAGSSRFEASVTPGRVPSLAGELPLRDGSWDLHTRRAGGGAMVPVVLPQALYEQLPLRTVLGHKAFALGMSPEQNAVLVASRDLEDDERGGFHQRRLRETAYAGHRSEPVREAVVYSSFNGRQYSDSPRAIHDELVRREAPLEHLWVVRDGMCRVPASATVVRMGSREYYEAFARSRFVVTNDHLPSWFSRRADQVCLQTWHGTPLKRIGRDMLEIRKNVGRRATLQAIEHAANWQYVLSPNRFSTAILRRAYGIEGELLETGYPRDDALVGPDRDAVARGLRRKLGLSEDVRVVLYAPTYRDQIVDSGGRYRLDLHLDLDRLCRAAGRNTVVLVRKHHRVADLVPANGNGLVRDVSAYPDGTELLLAADVLVTDYSSVMFDFANTRRPMLFFTYDLDSYRDQVRGLYLDLAEQAPGPLLRTTDELAAALDDIDGVRTAYAERYSEFVSRFCEFDDGHAAARVVDRVFSW